MAIEIKNINGGCCPYCGLEFGSRWGKRTAFNIRNLEVHILSASGPQILKMRICKTHWPLEVTDYQRLLDIHIEYFRSVGLDANGQTQLRVDEWQLDPQYYAS